MLGLLPYLYLIYQYKSYRALIVFMNGICYHYNYKNLTLRYYDILCNALISYYCFHSTTPTTLQSTYMVGYIVSISFLFNNLLFYKSQINERNSYIVHVLFTQWPCCYVLFDELNCN